MLNKTSIETIKSSLNLTTEELTERAIYLKSVKDTLDDWNKKPDSNIRFQTPDEQLENNNFNEFIEVGCND